MSLSDIVSVSIETTAVNVTAPGFGTPLIMGTSAQALFAERTRTYSSLSEMVDDSFTVNSPEYRAAAKCFAQSPRPASVKIGRCALPPTQRYLVEVASVANSTDYTLTVVDSAGVSSELTYTSDSNATNDEIIDGLVAAINATALNATAATTGSGGSLDMTVTADAAVNWFSVEVADTSLLSIQQNHADPGVATDLAAIKVYDDSWYYLICPYNSEAVVNAIAAWVESNDKFYMAAVNDSRSITAAVSGADPLDDLKTSAYARSMGLYHPSPANFFDAAMAGMIAPKLPGTATLLFKTLSSVAAYSLTSTHKTNLRNKYATYYITEGGNNVTLGTGKVGANEYADVIVARDWVVNEIQSRCFALFLSADKIPYTAAGMSQVEGVIWGVIEDAISMGIAADSPAPTVTIPDIADVSSGDKASRTLNDVEFEFTLAGAIHSLTVQGTFSV